MKNLPPAGTSTTSLHRDAHSHSLQFPTLFSIQLREQVASLKALAHVQHTPDNFKPVPLSTLHTGPHKKHPCDCVRMQEHHLHTSYSLCVGPSHLSRVHVYDVYTICFYQPRAAPPCNTRVRLQKGVLDSCAEVNIVPVELTPLFLLNACNYLSRWDADAHTYACNSATKHNERGLRKELVGTWWRAARSFLSQCIHIIERVSSDALALPACNRAEDI